jgi:hypothetical protein
MKNKKRIAVITSVVILVLVAGYYIYKILSDEDQDKISRKVMIASYESLFQKEVENRFGKPYDKIPDQEKYTILAKMINDEKECFQIVSIRYLSKLPDKERSLKIITPVLSSEKTAAIEEAIFSLKNYSKESVIPILTEFIKKSESGPDYSVPFSDSYRICCFGISDKSKVELDLEESEQNQLNLSNGEVYEINLLVPKGFDYMLSFPNFDDNWESFTDSKIISSFSKTDSYNDFKKLDGISDYFKIKKVIDDKLGWLYKFFEPGKLFRDDLKIAKYGPELLLVTFKGRNLEVMTNLVNLFKTVSDFKFDIFEENYKSAKITTIQSKISKKTISYSEISEYFVISDSPDRIRKSLDCFLTDNTNSITFDPNFQSEYNKLDLKGEKNFVFSYIEPLKISPFENKSAYSSYLVKISLKVIKELTGNNFSENKFLSNTQYADHNDLSLTNFITKNVPMYFYSTNANPRSVWNYFTGFRPDFKGDLADLNLIKKDDLERNIISNLSPVMFWSINGIDYNQNELDNKTSLAFCFGFRLLNSGLSGNVQNSMFNLFKTVFKKEIINKNYQGYDIYSSNPVSLNNITNQEMENSVAPSFAVVDGNLLITINRKILMEMIDSYKSGSSIDKSGINTEYSDNYFLNMNNFSNSYYKYLSKYSGSAKSFNQFEVEEKIKPFFEVLKLMNNLKYTGKTTDYHYSGKLILNLN